MLLSKLKQLCLAYLEQDIDTNVMNEDLSVLEENDVFKEYLNNIDGSIYSAISRLVQAYKLPIKTIKIKSEELENNFYELDKEVYQVKEISLVTKQGIIGNIAYQIIDNEIIIPNIVEKSTYVVIYYPRFLYFDDYLEIDEINNINDIDLSKHGLPDELAITIRFAVYGDMKSEENPSLAVTNRNYFEAVLESNNRVDVITNQPNLSISGVGDDEWQ